MSEPRAGWVLYDGDCQFCRRWMDLVREVIRRRGFEIAPLQAPWVAERLGLSRAALVEDLRLLTPDGALLSGANVYLHVTRRIWWAWWFSVLFSLPGFNWAIHRGYRWFADHRYCIGRACRLG